MQSNKAKLLVILETRENNKTKKANRKDKKPKSQRRIRIKKRKRPNHLKPTTKQRTKPLQFPKTTQIPKKRKRPSKRSNRRKIRKRMTPNKALKLQIKTKPPKLRHKQRMFQMLQRRTVSNKAVLKLVEMLPSLSILVRSRMRSSSRS